jgi:hypothetical protein
LVPDAARGIRPAPNPGHDQGSYPEATAKQDVDYRGVMVFVQVIQGRGSDPDRARELMAQDSTEWAGFRPEILGSVAVGHEGGAYTMAIYFTTEAAAREGERKEPPPELKAQMDEMAALSVGEPEFFDLTQPWLHSPR